MGQLYNCGVNHAGDLVHEIPKTNISAAEIMVLNHVHGEGSVVRIEPTKTVRTPHKKEYEYLVDTYGPKAVMEVFGTGFNVRLPNKLDLDAMNDDGDEELSEEDLKVE